MTGAPFLTVTGKGFSVDDLAQVAEGFRCGKEGRFSYRPGCVYILTKIAGHDKILSQSRVLAQAG